MKIIRSTMAASRSRCAADGRVVLVPTMGALHAGHRVLLEKGRALAGSDGLLVVSVFVNPTQFGPKEDFSAYPRTLRADAAMCRAAGVDVFFAPSAEAMYAGNHSTWVDECTLSAGLCGAARPGHFRGVCTVVAKLFNIVRPDVAVFGEKDWQQLAAIRRMTRDLNFPVRIVGVPTVREADGLAMSSRNRRLSEEERLRARGIYRALVSAQEAGQPTGAAAKRAIERDILETIPEARIEYIEIVDGETLEPVKRVNSNTIAAVAVFVGNVRLIENLRLLSDTRTNE